MDKKEFLHDIQIWIEDNTDWNVDEQSVEKLVDYLQNQYKMVPVTESVLESKDILGEKVVLKEEYVGWKD